MLPDLRKIAGRPPDGHPPDDQDLGFGRVLASDSGLRLLNRDGSFNVERHGLGFFKSVNLYHRLLTMTWPRFLALMGALFLATNGLFAGAYLAVDGLAGAGSRGLADAFFFSVQTLSTIGFGHVYPTNFAANVIVTFEALTGLLGVALIAGLSFARFSRPVAAIAFSERAVVAPYRGITALEFRITNRQQSEISNLEATVVLAWFGKGEPGRRRFEPLALERKRVVFFPLHWTIVHPIDESSPLAGWSEDDWQALRPEILVFLSGLDETFSQTVHVRSSYGADEVVWGARFVDILERPSEGRPFRVDVRRLGAIEKAELPARG